jgi:hypothetical protein
MAAARRHRSLAKLAVSDRLRRLSGRSRWIPVSTQSAPVLIRILDRLGSVIAAAGRSGVEEV